MSAFRTIFFRPRLALDWRIPVGALVLTPRGVRSVSADVLPDSRCLGGIAIHNVMKQGLAEVVERPRWDALPISVGPHFELSQELAVPESVDPVKWVKHAALPIHYQLHNEIDVRGHQLSTIAWNHLKAWRVSFYIKKRLRPTKLPETRKIPEGVSAITHYVEGAASVLLMEPLVLRRDTMRESIGAVFQKFSTYSGGWNSDGGRVHKNIAYVLPGTRDADLADLADQLAPIARVVDTGDDLMRREFIQSVQAIGETFNRLPLSMSDMPD